MNEDYYKYISDNVNKTIHYTEYIIEQVNKNSDLNIKYAEYFAERVNKNIKYTEYIAECLNPPPTLLEVRREKLDKIIKRINGK